MLLRNDVRNGLVAVATLFSVAHAPSGAAALAYSQNFETLDPNSATALNVNGTEAFYIGNCIVGGGCWFGPGNEAPNNTADGLNGYSALVTGQGGVPQGNNQLSIFSDYNPWSPFASAGIQTIDTFFFRDIGIISAGDVGKTYVFSFDGKDGGISNDPSSQAWAYLNVLQVSNNSYNTLFNGETETTNIGSSWSGGAVSVTIDAGMVGELLQIGFRNRTTEWGASGMVYDNLNVSAIPVPAAVWLFASGLFGLVGVARRRKG